MTFAIEESAKRDDAIGDVARASIAGRGCAVLGCPANRLKKCATCPANYCALHSRTHFHEIVDGGPA